MSFLEKLFGIKPREPKFDRLDNAIYNGKPIKITNIERNCYNNDQFLGYEYSEINWDGFDLGGSSYYCPSFGIDRDSEDDLVRLPKLREFKRENILTEEIRSDGIILSIEFKIKVESQKSPIKILVEPEVESRVNSGRTTPLHHHDYSDVYETTMEYIERNVGEIDICSLSDPEGLALRLLKSRYNRIIKPDKVLEVQYKVKTRPQRRFVTNIYYKEVE